MNFCTVNQKFEESFRIQRTVVQERGLVYNSVFANKFIFLY
jgi:hypothetical protein